MARLAYVLICQRALIDQRNTLSLIEIVEDVQVPAPPEGVIKKGAPAPLIPLKFAVVATWERSKSAEPETIECRIKFHPPTGKEYGATEESVVDLTAFQRNRMIIEVPGFPYAGPGPYTVHVEQRFGSRWRRVGGAAFVLSHPPSIN